MTKNYQIEGMTCEHCVKAIEAEVNEVHGTQGVDIDLASGRMAVHGEDFSDDAIIEAVIEAGYKVVEH
ncbi:heavy-metal-associated domain-containing protein [Corynebacterium sp. H128]|uniref:heavy-metal-associated domain-containing protein n=1 Tax=unclassified Corynebacterium TaxID=2624378 RepID=UPI00309B4801